LKPNIKQKVGVFLPMGFLDGENAESIITPADINFLLKEKLEGVFVSLGKVVLFNKRGISTLLDYLKKLKEEHGTIIGFCDYDDKKYKIMNKMFADGLNFSLFDSYDIATLFLGDDLKDSKEKKIIIYNENNELKNQLATELFERGFVPDIAKNKDDFLIKRKDFDYIIENSFFVDLDKSHSVAIKDNVIIYTLKSFIDSNFGNLFDSVYHNNSLRVGFRVFLLDATKVSSINIHGAEFISKLSTAGAEYDVTFAICGLNNRNITKNLHHDIEDSGVLIYPDMKSFFEDKEILKEADVAASTVKSGAIITKSIVSILPLVTESAVNTIEVLSDYKANKKSINIQALSVEIKEKPIGAIIGFYGDISCVLIMIIEKSVAKKTCKILLEESSDENDVIEALGELIHIIGNKISQKLSKEKLKLNITMPRVFENVDDLIASQKGSRGAQVDLEVDGKPLTLFLAK